MFSVGFIRSSFYQKIICILIFQFAAYSIGNAQIDSLSLKFKQPTTSAKPMIWWFWGESITTEYGITKDLEALHKAGFGGVVLYEQVFKDAPDAFNSLSPEWLSKVRFAAAECARLGLRLEINSSNGYVAGGPWITPDLGIQRLVSSETIVKGGTHISIKLEQPPTKLNYYKDVAVLAFPTVEGQLMPEPEITSIPKIANLTAIFDASNASRTSIKAVENSNQVLLHLDYKNPVTVRSITYGIRPSTKALVIATQMPGNWSDDYYGENMKPVLPIGELELSQDNVHWTPVIQLPGRGYQFESWDKQTLAFEPVTARYFRLNLHDWGPTQGNKENELFIGSVKLQGRAYIDQWEKKSGNTPDFSDPDATPIYTNNDFVDRKKIIDLSRFMDSTGVLNWNAPSGNWTILRFGHTPTGVRTKHGRHEGLGLESDRLSAKAATVQFDHYVGVIHQEIQKVPNAVLSGVNMDSGEHGSQNWTAGFAEEFKKMWGYDLLSYLPAMAGYIVENRNVSDHFLFDIRRTIANLMSDNFYGTFRRLCNAQGMTFMAQAPGLATCMPSDNIQAKGRTDIPMAEFWFAQKNGTIDCKEASSAAHIYGKNIVAAESFTGSKADVTMAQMKPLADATLVQGINRFVVLAYIHQPYEDRKPGVTEDRFYVPFQRNNTWWNESEGFWKMLGRSSQMMQSGEPVADILYHLGNDAPLKIATFRMRPAPPKGYDYDVCSDEILLQTTVKNGRIYLPSGRSYRLLILAGGRQLTLASLQHIYHLVKQGATILAQDKVTGTRSLADGITADNEVRNIADQLWGRTKMKTEGQTKIGLGKFVWGLAPAALLKNIQVPEDFQALHTSAKDSILFAHRKSENDEIFLVVNHTQRPLVFDGIFRVNQLRPQLWNPEDGSISGLKNYHFNGGTTIVPLQIEPLGSVFVVFRKDSISGTADQQLVETMPVWKELGSGWQLQFDAGRGAPKEIYFDKLVSWTSHPNFDVQHYAGTGVYHQNFNLDTLPSGNLVLDLGKVHDVATVKINGVTCPIVWKPPYAVDVTPFLKLGVNDLEVKITNCWSNRLIADAGLPPEKRISWTTFNPYKPSDPLFPSGLLGPVVLKHK